MSFSFTTIFCRDKPGWTVGFFGSKFGRFPEKVNLRQSQMNHKSTFNSKNLKFSAFSRIYFLWLRRYSGDPVHKINLNLTWSFKKQPKRIKRVEIFEELRSTEVNFANAATNAYQAICYRSLEFLCVMTKFHTLIFFDRLSMVQWQQRRFLVMSKT